MLTGKTASRRRRGTRRCGGIITLLLTVLWLPLSAAGPAAAQQAFDVWLQEFRQDALARGISRETLDGALGGVAPLPRVLELDRRQSEFTLGFRDYLDRAVSPDRIARGQALRGREAVLLERLERQWGVPGRFLTAFWGLETNYGDYTGNFPVIAALATLAHDPRRSGYFRGELLNALRILDAGHIRPENMTGSWAGAMGQVQFMPSTFLAHARDGDGNGRIDIWGSRADALTSAASFLHDLGWRPGQTWGREVRLPAGFDPGLAGLQGGRPLAAWDRAGVRRADGRRLPEADIRAALLLPSGYRGAAFLVYPNFNVIMKWNRSVSYALAIGHLADRINGAGPLVTPRGPDDIAISREDIIALQMRLNALGFDAGEADGLAGSRTRQAIRAYQQAQGLPADGTPTPGLLGHLGIPENGN